MIPEIGHYCLILAMLVAVVQIIIPMMGLRHQHQGQLAVARRAAYTQCVLLLISFTALAISFLTNDFSVAYVAENSNSHLPRIYQFCALWGAHEGSLLLWVSFLGIWMALVAKFSRHLPLDFVVRVLVVLAAVALGFYLLLLLTSNPFTRLLPMPPAEGRDLNALLQDPGLVSHPPMLYLGYVGFSVAFAFAIAALWRGELDAKWAAWTRPWTLFAWSFLTLGITLGSAWAYRVLGWGGWWFWDPVENASLMPWLAGTALLHSLAVAAKRNTFKAWTVLLAICAFSLSLIGTFLVRSGILVSVHAFAVDSARGSFILEFLTVVIGGSLLLYAWRGQSVRSQTHFDFASRETLILTNNVLLMTMMLTVLLGTLYPLVIDALGLGKLSVGPAYFNAVMMPLALPLIFLMGIAPLFQWGKQSISVIWQRLRWTLLFSLTAAILLPWSVTGQWHFEVVVCVALSLWLMIATWQSSWLRATSGPSIRRKFSLQHLGMMLAHGGIAITAIGMVISSLFGVQREVRMQVGETVSLAAYHFKLEKLQTYQGPNFQAQQAVVHVTAQGKDLTTLYPDIRYYPAQQNAQPHAAINANFLRDVYVVLGQPLPNESWSMRFYVKPLVRWIWAGGVMMMVGGLFAAMGLRRQKQSSGVQTNV